MMNNITSRLSIPERRGKNKAKLNFNFLKK